MKNELSFGDAFKYPFNKWTRMFNILWFLLPIFGWLALGGYGIRIMQEFVKGNYKYFIDRYSKYLDEMDLDEIQHRMAINEHNCTWSRDEYPVEAQGGTRG